MVIAVSMLGHSNNKAEELKGEAAMVTSIQLGNFFSSGGKTVLGGVGGSGLDTETLVQSLADAKALPATKLKDTITANGKISDALSQFQTKLSAVKDAASFLSNPPGVGNQAQNAFAYTTTTVVTSNGSTAANYLSVTTAPGVTSSSYNIEEITSVAAARQRGTENIANLDDADTAFVTASATANRFTAGAIVINGKTITLTTGDTLNQVASKFNSVSDDTGFTTSIIKVADDTYQLVFTANETGEDADFDFADPLFLTSGSAVFNDVDIESRQDASNAAFTVNGVDIVRQSNIIDDVYTGVTFNIVQETPVDVTLKATVSVDTTAVKNGVVNFINAYNEMRLFAAQQMEVGDDGKYLEDAVLANNSTFRNTISNLTSTLSQVVAGITGGDPSRLSEIGLTFADLPATDDHPLVRNILDLNEDTLNTAIANNFDAMRRVFEFDLQSNNTNLRVFSRTNGLAVNDFTIEVGTATPPDLPVVTASYDIGNGTETTNFTVTAIKDSTNGTIMGYTLEGPAGSPLSGLKLIYASTDAATITVTATQGLADKIFNIASGILDTNSGALKTELESLKTADTRLTDQIAKINEQVETYRQQLLAKFAALEQAISKVNTLLQSLDAQSQAAANSS